MLMKMIGGLLLWCGALTTSAVTLNQIVVFGDSLSDNGNLYEYMHHQLPLSPPYYKGRFSNGPVWIELLTQKYYPETANDHLLDYAFGGSGVEGEDDEPDDTLFTLSREVDSYLFAHQDKASDQTLYAIWIGANNYFSLPDDFDYSINNVMWGIHSNIDHLISKGAKYILVMNLPNLGQVPIAKEMDAVDALTYCSTHHNQVLEENVTKWRKQYPDVKLILVDVSTDFADMIIHPDAHNMSNVTGTCYEALLEPSLGKKNVLKMVSSVRKQHHSKDACDGYMFFDPVHPSILVHQELADKVFKLLNDEGVVFKQ